MNVTKHFLHETAVVVVGLAACCWFRLTGRPERAEGVWADVESELCGE
jgi:hypothetical protein